jgi:hypothetical protein
VDCHAKDIAMIIADDIRLPDGEEPAPNLLMILGKALADAFRDAVEEPLPEGLSRILREIEERGAADGQRA